MKVSLNVLGMLCGATKYRSKAAFVLTSFRHCDETECSLKKTAAAFITANYLSALQ